MSQPAATLNEAQATASTLDQPPVRSHGVAPISPKPPRPLLPTLSYSYISFDNSQATAAARPESAQTVRFEDAVESRYLETTPSTPISSRPLLFTTPPSRASTETLQTDAMQYLRTPPSHRGSLPKATFVREQPEAAQGMAYTSPPPEDLESGEWLVPWCICGDVATCLKAFCCPAKLIWKVRHRLNNLDKGKSALDLEESKGCCPRIPAMEGFNSRSRIRGRYKIKGSVRGDCCVMCFCAPCAILKNDREIRAREHAPEMKKFWSASSSQDEIPLEQVNGNWVVVPTSE